jgi:hypothetical protein
MIKEPAELAGADEMTVINWELRNRRPMKQFHKHLRGVLGIEVSTGRPEDA